MSIMPIIYVKPTSNFPKKHNKTNSDSNHSSQIQENPTP